MHLSSDALVKDVSMLQSEVWNRQGLASTPLSYCHRLSLLPGYLARHATLTTSSDATPLIMVPGLAGGLDFCLPFASRLSQHFAVHLLQPRGEDSRYDLSPRTTIEQLGTDIVEYQKSAGLERPMLFGHGFGAVVASGSGSPIPRSICRCSGSGNRPPTAGPDTGMATEAVIECLGNPSSASGIDHSSIWQPMDSARTQAVGTTILSAHRSGCFHSSA
jgi:pimeloyl-ACP methyl ester carboxylesterase